MAVHQAYVEDMAGGRVVVPHLVLGTVVKQQRFPNLPSPHLATNLDSTLFRHLVRAHARAHQQD